MRNAVANDASVLGGDEGLVLGVGVLGAGAEELEELVAAPVGLVDQLVGRERLAKRVRERREQLAVLGVDGVLRQDGGVLALVGNLGERRGRLAAVVGRARSVARGLVVDEALRRRWARVVEVVLVDDPVCGEERARVGVNGELAVGEDGGMVLEEGLEQALALVELADLEDETVEVGFVVA